MKRREVGEKKSSKKLVTVVMPAMIVMTLVTALFVVSATAGIDTFTNDTWNNWGNSATRAVNVTVVGLKGDINGDGKVTGIDAMKIKQYIAGLITLTPEQLSRADVNGDGKVTGIDAMKTKQAIIGLIPKWW